MNLRKRHLIADLHHVKYGVYYTQHQKRTLSLESTLESTGVGDLSTLELRAFVLGGNPREEGWCMLIC